MIAGPPVPAVARHRRGTGLACLVSAGLLWGTGGLADGLLGRSSGLPALSVAAYRLTAGGALIIAFLVLTGRRWPAGRAAWTRIAVIAGLAAMFQSCYFTAVSLTSVSLATLVTIGSGPVLVLAAERVRGGRPGRLAGGATGLALTGLVLLAGLPSGGFRETAVLAGAGMAVLAAAGFATLTLISARPVAGLDDLTATGLGFDLGGLVLLPAAVAAGRVGFTPRRSPSPCWPRSAPARPPWPTPCTFAGCGPPRWAQLHRCPCSSRSPAPSSRRSSPVTGSGPPGSRVPSSSPWRWSSPQWRARRPCHKAPRQARRPCHGVPRRASTAGQATARRTTVVAQLSTTTHSGVSTANACQTAGPLKVPAASTRAAVTA